MGESGEETTKQVAIDVHSHVESEGSAEIFKKRYREEEMLAKFIIPATSLETAEINRDLILSLRATLRDTQRKIPRDDDVPLFGLTSY